MFSKIISGFRKGLKNNIYKLKQFIAECRRVLRVTRKPSKEEFKTIVKVSGLGILFIGLIGFILQMIKNYIILRK